MNKIALGLFAMLLFFSCSQSVKKTKDDQTKQTNALITGNADNFILKLPDVLSEISGMLTWNGLFWGFNDSGGTPVLFGFDSSGTIKMELELVNAENKDWEAMTQDDNYLYVGDFGNNRGNRKDLCIYKISKKDITELAKQKVSSERINFQYASQTSFGFSLNSTTYDCEAMVAMMGQLYLFSKNWEENTTEVYCLQTTPGTNNLEAIDTLDVNLLVTGADISPDKTKLALIGYLDYRTYLWVFSDFETDEFRTGTSTYFNLKNINGAQTEGISFLNNDSLLISCEETSGFNQQVFLFDLNNELYGTH